MKPCSSLYLVAWALYAYAAPVDLLRRDEPLSVQLTAAGNSAVKVVVTNNSDMALNLLSTGTLFDDKLPVERTSMFANNSCEF